MLSIKSLLHVRQFTLLFSILLSGFVYPFAANAVWAPAGPAAQSIGFDLAPSDPSSFLAAATLANQGMWYKNTGSGGVWVRTENTTSYSNVAFHPTNDLIAVAGIQGGEIRLTGNGGSNWSSTTGSVSQVNWFFDFSVSDPNVVYAGGFTSNSGKFLRSDDMGSSWTSFAIDGDSSPRIDSLAVDPKDETIVYAGVRPSDILKPGGIYKSTNSGQDWSYLSNFIIGSQVDALVVDPIDSQLIYAGTRGIGIIGRSIDGGQTWSEIHSPFAAGGIAGFNGVWGIAIDPADRRIIYAVGGGGATKVIYSSDCGQTWTNLDPAGLILSPTKVRLDTANNLLYALPEAEGVIYSEATPANVGTGSCPAGGPGPTDTVPNAFSFTDQVDVPLSSSITSASITISGINAAAAISVTGGTYSINGGAFTATASTVANGNTVRVRHTSAATNSTAVNSVLTVGGVSDTFSSTTVSGGVDTVPNAFSFTDQADVPLSSSITSASITISGINAAAAISVTGGTYSINGGAFSATAATVANGNTVRVRHTSAATNSTAVNTVLTVGGVSDTFSSTTVSGGGVDTVPNVFSFTDQADVPLSSSITSASITISGINAAAAISVTGGTYSINGGAFTAAASTVANGNTLRLRHTSSATNSAATNTELTVGGVSDTFTSTTTNGGGTSVSSLAKGGSSGSAFNYLMLGFLFQVLILKAFRANK